MVERMIKYFISGSGKIHRGRSLPFDGSMIVVPQHERGLQKDTRERKSAKPSLKRNVSETFLQKNGIFINLC